MSGKIESTCKRHPNWEGKVNTNKTYHECRETCNESGKDNIEYLVRGGHIGHYYREAKETPVLQWMSRNRLISIMFTLNLKYLSKGVSLDRNSVHSGSGADPLLCIADR